MCIELRQHNSWKQMYQKLFLKKKSIINFSCRKLLYIFFCHFPLFSKCDFVFSTTSFNLHFLKISPKQTLEKHIFTNVLLLTFQKNIEWKQNKTKRNLQKNKHDIYVFGTKRNIPSSVTCRHITSNEGNKVITNLNSSTLNITAHVPLCKIASANKITREEIYKVSRTRTRCPSVVTKV